MQNKHLLGVFQWPMIYYPLKLLENAGITDIMIVTGQEHAGQMIEQLGNGQVVDRDGREILSLNLTYRVQMRPGGIAQAISLAKDFCRDCSFAAILGDNIFEQGIDFGVIPENEAHIFICEVKDPERFGVPIFQSNEIIEIIEKPKTTPSSNFAVTGLYVYGVNSGIFDVIAGLKPSGRGELEITDVNNHYIKERKLFHSIVQGWWRDVGTYDSLTEVGALIKKTGACGIRF